MKIAALRQHAMNVVAFVRCRQGRLGLEKSRFRQTRLVARMTMWIFDGIGETVVLRSRKKPEQCCLVFDPLDDDMDDAGLGLESPRDGDETRGDDDRPVRLENFRPDNRI